MLQDEKRAPVLLVGIGVGALLVALIAVTIVLLF